MAGFHDIIGHEKIKEHLQKAIGYQRVSHAYILSGEEGMGRKTIAKAFAMTLLCEKHGTEPCMECHSCKQFLSGNHPDVIWVTHEKPASIGVDDVRIQINDTVSIRPYSSPYKIYLVDEAEKMTVQAQNALLKTIEEPPAYAVLVLITTNPEVFLPTILSRCIQLKLRPLKDSVVSDYLTEKMGVSDGQADIYAAFARGNLGKAIHLASSEEFALLYREVLTLLKNIKDMDIPMLLDYIRKLQEDNLDLYECLDFMQLWYRDILMFKVTKDMNSLIFKDEYSGNRIIHSDLIRAGFFRYDLSVLQHIFQIANTAFISVLILLSGIIFEVFAQVTLCARLLDRLDRLFADHQLPMVDLFLNLLYITFCQLLSHVLLCQSLFFYHFYNLCYIFSADFIRRCLDHHADQRLRTTRTN